MEEPPRCVPGNRREQVHMHAQPTGLTGYMLAELLLRMSLVIRAPVGFVLEGWHRGGPSRKERARGGGGFTRLGIVSADPLLD